MSRRNPAKRIGKPDVHVNGWVIEPQPNSFGSTHVYVAFALDERGFQIESVGFQSLRAAKAFCAQRPAPTSKGA